MRPTRNIRSYFAGKIAQSLEILMGPGKTLVECAVETADGTKVSAVSWASPKTFAIIKEELSCSVAPEICIDVLSPSNQANEMELKKQLYLRAGAQEYWTCNEDGHLHFYTPDGEVPNSILCPGFPRVIE